MLSKWCRNGVEMVCEQFVVIVWDMINNRMMEHHQLWIQQQWVGHLDSHKCRISSLVILLFMYVFIQSAPLTDAFCFTYFLILNFILF